MYNNFIHYIRFLILHCSKLNIIANKLVIFGWMLSINSHQLWKYGTCRVSNMTIMCIYLHTTRRYKMTIKPRPWINAQAVHMNWLQNKTAIREFATLNQCSRFTCNLRPCQPIQIHDWMYSSNKLQREDDKHNFVMRKSKMLISVINCKVNNNLKARQFVLSV